MSHVKHFSLQALIVRQRLLRMLIVSVIVTGASANYCPGVLGQFNNINVQPSSVSDWTFCWCTAGNLMHSDQRDAPLSLSLGIPALRLQHWVLGWSRAVFDKLFVVH